MDLTNIIIKPYHTEKSYGLRKMQDPSCLVFVVNKKASKDLIKLAFKTIYDVMPTKVNIINKKPKKLRYTNSGYGYSKEIKLAYIILPKGVQIALTKDEMEEAANQNKKTNQEEKPKKEVKEVKQETKKEPAPEKPAKKAKPTDIPIGKKHEVVSMKEFEDYDYDKRRKEWHQKAGHNEKQVVCSICKDDDNWASVKLENGKHVCYYCWIKKPETLEAMKKSKK